MAKEAARQEKKEQTKEEKRKKALRIVSAIFAIFAIVHFVRLLTGFEVVFAGVEIPLWFSLVALALLGSFSLWLYNLTCS